MRTKPSLIRIAALLLCGASSAMAQISNASLLGTVTDSSGGVIAGASVEIKNVATLTTRS